MKFYKDGVCIFAGKDQEAALLATGWSRTDTSKEKEVEMSEEEKAAEEKAAAEAAEAKAAEAKAAEVVSAPKALKKRKPIKKAASEG